MYHLATMKSLLDSVQHNKVSVTSYVTLLLSLVSYPLQTQSLAHPHRYGFVEIDAMVDLLL